MWPARSYALNTELRIDEAGEWLSKNKAFCKAQGDVVELGIKC